MTKRARWDGPGTINVFLPEDTEMTDPVARGLEPGQLLPTETMGGESVPAAVRDELLARENWSEVNQSDQSKSETKPEKKDDA